jgi:hypothetical protein
VAVGVDVRSLERIVLRHLPTLSHAQDLARQAAEVLREPAILRPPRRDIQMSVGTYGDASAIVKRAWMTLLVSPEPDL